MLRTALIDDRLLFAQQIPRASTAAEMCIRDRVYVSRDGVIGCEWNGASEIDYVDKSECELIPFSQVQLSLIHI